MKYLITITVVLTLLTSCEKNCYKFRCTNTTTTSNGGSQPSSTTIIDKCDLTSKDSKNIVKAMNGTASTTINGTTVTVKTSCSASVN